MLLLILAVIANQFALKFHKGQTFSYMYDSSVESNADTGKASSNPNIITTLNATFTVTSTAADGVYMKLTISNMKLKIRQGSETNSGDDYESRQKTQAKCVYPLYFKYVKNGTITDVMANKNDDEETVNLKVNVAYSLRTNLNIDPDLGFSQDTVIDPMGQHAEYAMESVRGNSREIEIYYSEDDFDQFSDDQISNEELSVDCQMYHLVDNTKISKVTTTTSVVVNKQSARKDEEDIPLKYIGSFSLAKYTAMADSNVENDEITSLPKFLSENRDYALVGKLRPAHYLIKMATLSQRSNGGVEYLPKDHVPSSKLNTQETSSGCPASCTLCKSIGASQSLGNSNIGLAFSTSVVIGVEKGCKSAKRSYVVGAYVSLDLKALGKTVSVVEGIAEYGMVDGVKKSNQISLSLFGKSVYQKTFDQLDCTSKSKNLFDKTQKLPLIRFTFPVFCVLVSVEIGIELNFKADIVYQLCPNEFNASITFVPAVTASLYGSVKASIIIASASISLSASVTDSLEPSVYVDGNLCRVGFKLENHFHGITASLGYSYRILFWSHSGTIWSHTWAESRQKLLDKHYP